MELEIKNSDSFEQLNRKKAREDAMDRILSLKAESFPQSERVYLTMSDGTGVPFRQINLTGSNPSVMVYDTAGVYGDSGASLDLYSGLSPIREQWIKNREVEKVESLNKERSSFLKTNRDIQI